jgi:hypothetical protein
VTGAHTPGPWKWWTSNSWRRLRHEEGRLTRDVLMPDVCRDGQPDICVTEADMALIAAAPDLLSAAIKLDRMALVIESAVRRANDGNYHAVLSALKAIEAAIAKAEGRP